MTPRPTLPRGAAIATSRTPRPAVDRVQGAQRLAWPPGFVDEADNCCVAVRVRVAIPAADGTFTLELDLPRVGFGPALPTLLDLVGYRFLTLAREILEYEIDAVGWIDPRCPLRLERVVRGNPEVFIEALVLPFGEEQGARLGALMRSQPSPVERHQRGWEFARDLERLWAAQASKGRIPRRFLDVDFRVVRAADADPRDTHGLGPAADPLLPLTA